VIDTSGKLASGPTTAFSVVGSTGDSVPPDATVLAPVPSESVPLGLVTVSGAATDNVAVVAVDVAVRNSDTGAWLRPDGSWGSFAWNAALLDTPGALSSGWSWSFTTAEQGSYGLMVRATDVAGNVDPNKPWVSFTTTSGGGDVEPPDAVVAGPLRNQSVPIGVVEVTGSATDDVGVGEVSVAVRNNDTGAWLRPDGSWGGFAWNAALLDSPESPSTAWSWSFPTAEPGSFGLQVRARDTSGNLDPTKPWIPFSVN
jgi:hypothetical protein